MKRERKHRERERERDRERERERAIKKCILRNKKNSVVVYLLDLVPEFCARVACVLVFVKRVHDYYRWI